MTTDDTAATSTPTATFSSTIVAVAEYRDRILHVDTEADGSEWFVYNGARTPAGGLCTAGFSDEDVDRVRNGEISYTDTRPSGWPPTSG